MITFKNKVLVIGYGSVSRCVLPIFFKHIRMPYRNVTVIDFADKRDDLRAWTKKGVKYFQEKVTPINIAQLLAKHVSAGGLIIDLAWDIETIDILSWCHDNHVLYVNAAVEEWDPYSDIHERTPMQKSLYYLHMKMREKISAWDKNNSTTAVIDHGANPGLVSHFTKKALTDIALKEIDDGLASKRMVKRLKRHIDDEEYAKLAMDLGVKVIHISERDTQVSNKPKKKGEFVGTWSIEGLREEGIAPSELGWGTHEKKLPLLASAPDYGPRNQIFISQMGMNTWVRSWVPHEEIIGMAIRHGEAFTISEHLTVWKASRAIYRPTVHYAYMPCDATMASLHELRGRNYDLQPKLRIMNDEITDGEDILGVLVAGHKYKCWWTGSVLNIKQARKLVPHQNSTTVQVAIGVVSAILWMIKNPQKGICVPDDLPHEFILDIAKPYLGKFLSEPVDWDLFKNYRAFFKEDPGKHLDKKNPWCFENFLFRD